MREFTDAVRCVGAGGSVINPEVVSRLVGRARQSNPLERLTEQERAVLTLMAEGRSNQAIADRMVLSPKDRGGTRPQRLRQARPAPGPDDHRRVLAPLAFLHS
jgi:hypothetical protein